MLAANSGLSSSSASRERIQSQVAFSSAEFFCKANPFHFSMKTLAPYDWARATVLSVLPESTTMTSSAMPFTLSRVRAILASSFKVMMQTERVMREEYQDMGGSVLQSRYVQSGPPFSSL